ncbi:MAG: GHMP kinase [Methanobrevibacter sp.]|jgi:pantoate kinase|nr:GHMP kinase [Methanobrevibacter sp.]
MKISVFVPSHITGFFSIYDNLDPLKKGSCGGGILIDKGVTTTVKLSNKENTVDIKINNKNDPKNETISLKTIELLKKQFNFEDGLKIEQKIEVPTGSGFGTSAASALGIAIAISKILNLPLSKKQAEQIAHKAEIAMSSGLGDVIAETSKGIVIRKIPGAPGIGKTDSIPLKIAEIDFCHENLDLYVITKTLGELETSKIIQDPLHKENINKIGIAMQKKIIANPTISNFMDCSYNFAKKTELMNKEVENIVEELKSNTLGSSMAMLGNTAFALSTEPDCDLDNVLISKVDVNGIKIK